MAHRIGTDNDRRLREANPCTVRQRHLVGKNIGLAKYLAGFYSSHRRLGDEAVGVALLALTEAAQDWDSERCPQFGKYARYRIKAYLARAMKSIYHLRGVADKKGAAPVDFRPVGPDRDAGEVDVVDHRHWRDVDAEDEVCWLLSRLKPYQVDILRARFWKNVGDSEVVRERGITDSAGKTLLGHTLRELRDLLSSSYRKSGGTTPPLPHPDVRKGARTLYQWEGKYWNLSDLANHLGMKYSTLKTRVTTRGWPLAKAIYEPVDSLKGTRSTGKRLQET